MPVRSTPYSGRTHHKEKISSEPNIISRAKHTELNQSPKWWVMGWEL